MPILAGFIVPHPPLIVAEIGRGQQNQVRKTIDSYRSVAQQIAKLKPETIIISSPHCELHRDKFHISTGTKASGSFADFAAPQVSFEQTYDTHITNELIGLCKKNNVPIATNDKSSAVLDHGTMLPLYFIKKVYPDFKLVRLGLSWTTMKTHFRFGQLVAQAVSSCGSNAVYVASGDLSHKLQPYGPYGFAKEGPVYDDLLIRTCEKGALSELAEFDEQLCANAAECGHRSFVILSGALSNMPVRSKVLSHETVTGVGYGVCTFYPIKPEDPYVALAQKAIRAFVTTGEKIPVPDDTPNELVDTRAAAFVSIHKHGSLRGCIGTILPTEPSLAQEIISNAISACSRDWRFDPVTPDELDDLEINVDVLTEPELIDSKDKLDVRRYGVIVTSAAKRGLLLPDLEGVDSVDQQISIAMQKGGIRQNEPMTLHRFEVVRHK